jgi:gentisate 1,2-dioxygenase
MATFFSKNIRSGARTFAVVVGDPLVIQSNDVLTTPMTIHVHPGSSGGVVVEYQMGYDGEWFGFTEGNLSGTITTEKAAVFEGSVSAMRFTASTANAVVGLGW